MQCHKYKYITSYIVLLSIYKTSYNGYIYIMTYMHEVCLIAYRLLYKDMTIYLHTCTYMLYRIVDILFSVYMLQ